ncbi:MAG: hypothetical protein Q4B68_00110 [Bacteroidales bacterium]|nr:hypothetical protein [Bacteroidales bacterium]
MENYVTDEFRDELLKVYFDKRDKREIQRMVIAMLMANNAPRDNGKLEKDIVQKTVDLLLEHKAFKESEMGSYYDKEKHLVGSVTSVFFSPACTLRIMTSKESYKTKEEWKEDKLIFTVNYLNSTEQVLQCSSPEKLAAWIENNKRQFDSILKQADNVATDTLKRFKKNQLCATLAKAILEEEVKEYPAVRYTCEETLTDLTFTVNLPDSPVGVCIHASKDTYEQTLPPKAKALKRLIEVHRNCPIKEFFINR